MGTQTTGTGSGSGDNSNLIASLNRIMDDKLNALKKELMEYTDKGDDDLKENLGD